MSDYFMLLRLLLLPIVAYGLVSTVEAIGENRAVMAVIRTLLTVCAISSFILSWTIEKHIQW